MKITDFIAARLDDDDEFIDGIRADLEANPPQGNVASVARGFVVQHDSTRRLNDTMIVPDGSEVPDNAEHVTICRIVATRWAHHSDFQPEWRWRSHEVRNR
ncbi:hypothetical protein [Gordonia hongkongensis]|uniref:Uncharacterized protein n=1 Tax=Gordonia hongkongensis TaxID=1701090 RepID=A0ABT6BVL8_9ACTN|nr:hypothetical protein [Gordonia hongkongensis]MDF6101745.1 hypothetical protein [Gordonia hongkongensis]